MLLWPVAQITHGEEVTLEHTLFRAVRGESPSLLRSIVRSTNVNVRSADGITPLMEAALHGSAETVRLLLENGANPNAQSDKKITPLLWAASDFQKTKLLLEKGADPNIASSLGNTPLITAAGFPGGASVVELLIDNGAEMTVRNRRNWTALRNATFASDFDSFRLIIAKAEKANLLDALIKNDAPNLLYEAAEQGSFPIAEIIVNRFKDKITSDGKIKGDSFTRSLVSQKPDIAALLIKNGADLERRLSTGKVPPILLAAYSEVGDTSIAKMLIEQNADVEATNNAGETAVTWATRRGFSPVINLLKEAGVPHKPDQIPEIPNRRVTLSDDNRQALLRSSVEKSLELLQHTSDVFLDNRKTCISCHHQNMPAVAIGWARDRGISSNGKSVKRMITRQIDSWGGRIDRIYQMDRPVPVSPRFIGYGLWAFGELGYAPDKITDAYAWYLRSIQQPDGRWVGGMQRPPMGGSDILSTVLALRSLQFYGPESSEQLTAIRLQKAKHWLQNATAQTHQERVFQLLGLGWLDAESSALKSLADQLISEQLDDGGWSQLPNLSSDAWATGQTLVALNLSGSATSQSTVYQRGLEFLLRTQFDDGSWFVKTRTWPFQAHFDSEFPFDRDQWISAPATAWAVMAMLLSMEPSGSPAVAKDVKISDWRPHGNDSQSAPDNSQAKVSFRRDIKPIFERSCVACHHGENPKGGLRVTELSSLLEGGESGDPAIVPANAKESPLLRFVSATDDDMVMPPRDKRAEFPELTKDQIAKLTAWIAQGAVWPEDVSIKID